MNTHNSPASVDDDPLNRRPPPKIEGMLLFAKTARQNFSREEMDSMFQSEAGSKVFESLLECREERKDARDARIVWANDTQDPKKWRMYEQQKDRYSDCISSVVCPYATQQYIECWESLRSLDKADRESIQQIGPELLCKDERQALEQCIGNAISRTLTSADLYKEDPLM